MSAELPTQPGKSGPSKPLSESTEQTAISTELVHAIADRIYTMLLHDLKIERERERFTVRSGRR